MILKYAMTLIAFMAIAGGQANARQETDTAKRLSDGASSLNLPIYVMDAKPTKDTLAILYPGDGGWQELDSAVGGYLQSDGIPVVGLNSLSYFWSEHTASDTAKDLGRIIDDYTKRFNVQHVVLIGYSFGADVMPASYNRLSREQKAKIKKISLLSLSHTVDYVVSIRGWLGFRTEGKGGNPVNDVKSIKPELIQCIYGKSDDHDNACPSLQGTGIQVIGMPGGHHFAGDYEKLAHHIIAGLKPRPIKPLPTPEDLKSNHPLGAGISR